MFYCFDLVCECDSVFPWKFCITLAVVLKWEVRCLREDLGWNSPVSFDFFSLTKSCMIPFFNAFYQFSSILWSRSSDAVFKFHHLIIYWLGKYFCGESGRQFGFMSRIFGYSLDFILSGN